MYVISLIVLLILLFYISPIFVKPEPIYCIPLNEIGNCLRSISSMKILADDLKRPFKIDTFMLREKDAKIVKILFPEYIENSSKIPNLKSGIYSCVQPTNTDPIVECEYFGIPSDPFKFGHYYAARPGWIDDSEFIKRKLEFYRNLNFPKFKMKNVKNITGIHLRYTDNLLDKNKKFLNTPIDVFKKKLETVESPFLFCSDNDEIIDYVKNKYPETVFPDKMDDPDLQSIYEMMLLSETKHIIGSYASTFSYESAFFKGGTLEIYEKGRWKIYNI